ncbi:hypothetical protein [Maribacter aquivivus]|uniref:hypothetical protein n=1 Tax=Maribacter aquivivus TaxID=228958 RepID=UPI00249091C7|nr:hypothetical protein [Maribacter aquivivus]
MFRRKRKVSLLPALSLAQALANSLKKIVFILIFTFAVQISFGQKKTWVFPKFEFSDYISPKDTVASSFVKDLQLEYDYGIIDMTDTLKEIRIIAFRDNKAYKIRKKMDLSRAHKKLKIKKVRKKNLKLVKDLLKTTDSLNITELHNVGINKTSNDKYVYDRIQWTSNFVLFSKQKQIIFRCNRTHNHGDTKLLNNQHDKYIYFVHKFYPIFNRG